MNGLRVAAIAVVAAGVAAYACGGDAADLIEADVPSRILLSTDTLDLFVAETTILNATVIDALGEAVTGRVAWSSSDPAVATVDAEGLVRGVGPGDAEVRAELSGISAGATVRVAEGLSLRHPVEGAPSADYYLNHYVTHEGPGGAPVDYRCGLKAPADHTGTDFALPDFEAMRAEEPVFAAAAGIVTEVHDGESNFSIHIDPDTPPNRIVIDHGQGRRTVYENLWEGTLEVSVGDSVEAGKPLALIGSSGGHWIPHLHFEVRLNDRVVDPFSGPCAGSLDLWTDPPPYHDSFEVLRARVSDYQLQTAPHLAVDVPAPADTIFTGREFVAWVQELNAAVLSRSRIRIRDATGELRHESDQLRLAGPEGLTWFGRRISAPDESALGTWTMEHLYEDSLVRLVPFEVARR